MAPRTRSQTRIATVSAVESFQQLKRTTRPNKQRHHKMMSAISAAPNMISAHSLFDESNASTSSPSQSIIRNGNTLQALSNAQNFVATFLPTSPASLSPSSLFDHQDIEDDEDDFNHGKIRGWLSETSKHLSSSDIPSSRSTKKKTNQIVWSPWTRMNATAVSNSIAIDNEEEEDMDGPSNSLPISPTLEIAHKQQRITERRVRRIRSLPHQSSVSSWKAISESYSVESRKSFSEIKLSEPGPSRRSQLNESNSVESSSRPATPSSSVRKQGLKAEFPFRPQSAMKHRSANEYSSGKNVPTIVVSSGILPHSGEGFEEEENSFLSADKIPEQLASLKRQRESINRSPLQTKSTFPERAYKKKMMKKSQDQSYILHSRASLPKNSFYQRTKQEEGSPTPSKRIKTFPSFV